MSTAGLAAYGWDEGWAAALEVVADRGGARPEPGRVVRHDGVALTVATSDGTDQYPMRIDAPAAVGDWVVVRDGAVAHLLPRRSLLRRRDPDKGVEQLLAANIDIVGVVCGLDRPVKDGRIQRASLLARDAGAEPLVVLTKADLVEDVDRVVDEVESASPGVDVVVVSVPDSEGIDDLRRRLVGRTVVLIGESGAGKSTLVNLLAGDDVAATGEVRRGDAKGRHTTTARELYLLATGGVIIDSPGIRSVGVWGDPAAVAASFTDIAELARSCRFSDCFHDSEPGCAVREAVDSGDLARSRFQAWQALAGEAAEAEERAEVTARREARRSRR
ncbi:MAG: ribosome small subunit-dependent GTPase A [Acidimicrobiales bacterium]|nr:ribosome small subunit-dependent GTPase A [Acidimicrobiales bacterium]